MNLNELTSEGEKYNYTYSGQVKEKSPAQISLFFPISVGLSATTKRWRVDSSTQLVLVKSDLNSPYGPILNEYLWS